MKRLIKLLFIIPLLFIVSVSAKTLDMNGQYFTLGTFVKSGDIITNVSPRDEDTVWFEGRYAFFLYRVTPNETVPSPPVNVHSLFYNYNSYPEAFNVPYGERTQLIVPTFYGMNVIYRYEVGMYSFASPNPIHSTVGRTLYNGYDDFKVLQTEPEIIIVCDKDNLQYGEKSKCTMHYKHGEFDGGFGVNNYIDFNLTSDDYEISNIESSYISNFNINGTHITGYPLDYEKLYALEELYYDDPSVLDGIIEFNRICLYETIENEGTSCRDYLREYQFDSLTFEITPKVNDTKEGKISVSDFKLSVTENMDNVISDENLEQIIPMTGNGEAKTEVKGVEENPQTGLFNYLLLVIPVGLLMVGLYSLSKVKVFRKI